MNILKVWKMNFLEKFVLCKVFKKFCKKTVGTKMKVKINDFRTYRNTESDQTLVHIDVDIEGKMSDLLSIKNGIK